MADRPAPQQWAATLGMFIIDEFRFEDPETGENLGDRGLGDQIGGGGTYFAVGARTWLPPQDISMTIDRGYDFPQAIQDKLDTFSLQNVNGPWRWRERKSGKTTRAVNIYRGEQRGFMYLNEKIRLDPVHLLEGEGAASSTEEKGDSGTFPRFIHFICSPQRALQIVDQVDEMKQHWPCAQRPRLVWEPIPDSAIPENLPDCITVMQRIDVISPNHEEAASLLSVSLQDISSPSTVPPPASPSSAETDIRTKLTKRLAVGLAQKCPTSARPIVCIRSGKYGSAVLVPADAAACSNECQVGWVEAYHTDKDASRVIDVTGAGNAWLGGFIASLVLEEKKGRLSIADRWSLDVVLEAARMGSISASFVVEQMGLPAVQGDKWNDDSPQERLERLKSRPPTPLRFNDT